MLKLKTSTGLVVLGLARVNIDRLVAGKPITFEGRSLGIPGDLTFCITFGETEIEIARELGIPDEVSLPLIEKAGPPT
jgi:hypothetical protein